MFRRIKILFFFLLGKCIAICLYDKRYLVTDYFKRPSSLGYRWAFYDFCARITTGQNRGLYFPVGPMTRVPHPENIVFDPEDLRVFQAQNIYFQGIGAKTYIGRHVWIASNVCLITANHDLNDPDLHLEGKDIVIGDYSWIGANAIILPGVVLGPHTIVGSGAIVTKSFPEGNVVIVGNPAKAIRRIDSKN